MTQSEKTERNQRMIKATCFRFNSDVDKKPRYETYETPIEPMTSVLNVLEYIYENLDSTLAYHRHTVCRRGICGRCTVNVNGKPCLACQTIVNDDIIIEPIPKRKVVRDIFVE